MEAHDYFWKAVNAEGRIIQGTWQAAGLDDIRRRLFREGYYPLLIRTSLDVKRILARLPVTGGQQTTLRFWANFSQRLGMLLESGISMTAALELMSLQARGKASHGPQTNWTEVKGAVENGLELSEALNFVKSPPTAMIRALLRAGEQAGKLPQILTQLASDLEAEYQFRRKIRGALAYPCFLFVLSLGVIYTLSQFILPVYAQVFTNLDSSLPILTSVIFSVARWIPLCFSLILGIVLGGYAFLRLRYKGDWKDQGREWLGRFPFGGFLTRQSDQVQFFRILATLMEAGIPLLDALILAEETVRLPSMKVKIRQFIAATREGRRLSLLLHADPFFSPEVALLWTIGEESGHLSTMLQHLTKMQQQEIEEKSERWTSILGPVSVIGMAALIGVVAIGVMLPVFEVGTRIQ